MKPKIKRLTVTALFAVVMAACAWITIPFGAVPLTLQTFSVALTGYILDKKHSVACTALYLIMGAMGLPVFSSMQGGFSVLISPTGGFLFGFIPLCFLCGFGKSRIPRILFGLLGLLICHIIGIAQLCIVSQVSPLAAFLSASLPFIFKDIICISAAEITAERVKKEIEV